MKEEKNKIEQKEENEINKEKKIIEEKQINNIEKKEEKIEINKEEIKEIKEEKPNQKNDEIFNIEINKEADNNNINNNINNKSENNILNENKEEINIILEKKEDIINEKKEYLFIPFSFFRIIRVKRSENENEPHVIYLMALNSDESIEDMIIDFMENVTDNLDPEGLDILELDEYNTKIIINNELKCCNI